MSKTPSPTKTGSKKQLPLEASPDPASKPESSKFSSSLLTVENVKKHQEENLYCQWSIETYIEESNRFLNESGTKAEGSREQAVSNEEESRVLREDFQTRPLSAPVPETQSPKKREVADLETQTEWSYSVSSEDSSELKIEKEQQRRTDRKKKSETTEGTETLYRVEEEGISESEPETPESTTEEEEKVKSFLLDEVRFRISSFFQAYPAFHANAGYLWQLKITQHTDCVFEDHLVTDLCLMGRCEFCTSLVKRLPSPEELEEKPEAMDHFLCCRTYKEVFRWVIQDFLEKPGSGIDIRPHGRLSLGAMDSKMKAMLIDELHERGFERYREIFTQYMKFGPCVKIKFRLSDYPPKPETTILKKRHPEPQELLEIDLEFKAEQLKLKDPTMLWVLQQYGTTEHLVRPSVLEKIRKILANVKKALKKLESDPSEEAADLRPVLKVYERMRQRQKKKKRQEEARRREKLRLQEANLAL
ncbi:uncharacterized protein LOC113425189 [Notechis scutatus]|uniref:Uncharacterized protein LOC113425189 n=1 Tax=Notechis scutatus TaxID=8663 RepID=A0A6J1VJ87_9SAUR|nr:uncharacterized protein LOC113425189 [Notechis scutatus]